MRRREAGGGRRGDNEGETGAMFTLNGALFVARKSPRKILGRESGVGSWDGWRAGGAVSFELVVRDGAGLTSWRGTLAVAAPRAPDGSAAPGPTAHPPLGSALSGLRRAGWNGPILSSRGTDAASLR